MKISHQLRLGPLDPVLPGLRTANGIVHGVLRNPVDPGEDRRLPLEGVDRAKHSGEGLLNDLLGVGVVSKPQVGEVVDALIVPLVEEREIALVGSADPFDEFFIAARRL
jgi:hypothetical protein